MSNYLSKTGLSYFFNRIKTLFADKAEFDTLKGQVDELVAEGGEPNVIETVKVNGTALTPTNKAVNIEVPQATSDLNNDGDGDSPFATEAYVGENGGKIDKIMLNGTEQAIVNKVVSLVVAQVTGADDMAGHQSRFIISDGNAAYTMQFDKDANGLSFKMKHDSTGTILAGKTYVDETFRTEAQVQQAIDDALADVTGIDFQVVDTLPATGAKGIIYLVANASSSPNSYDEYIWVTPAGGTSHYEKIGTTEVDLTGYWSKSELVAITTAEIDAIIAA